MRTAAGPSRGAQTRRAAVLAGLHKGLALAAARVAGGIHGASACGYEHAHVIPLRGLVPLAGGRYPLARRG